MESTSIMYRLKLVIANTLIPVARGWIRYSPILIGKKWLWQHFSWRLKNFECRTIFGSQVTGNTKDLIQSYLYYFGVWEPRITKWINDSLTDGDTFIDVGANIGYYSLLASKRVGSRGKVVAIEAAPWIYDIALKHLELNACNNVRALSVAASHEKGLVRIYPGSEDNIGNTTIVPREGNSFEIQALPICDILLEEEILSIRIIKIDVEGAELQVVKGMIPILPRLKKNAEILIEILTPQPEIFSIMYAHGYSAFVINSNYSARSYMFETKESRPVHLPVESEYGGDIIFSKMNY